MSFCKAYLNKIIDRYDVLQLPNNLKEFMKRCLLFNSDEKIDWILGGFGWAGIVMIAWAVYKIGLIILKQA